MSIFSLFAAALTAAIISLASVSLAPVRAVAQGTVADALPSVVSLLPGPGARTTRRRAAGAGAGRGQVPEASGIVVGPDGLIATAAHVVDALGTVEVRLADGRRLPARHLGSDAATDIALLQVGAPLPVIPFAPQVQVASPVCAIGNAYGLDLSVTCGVVSARGVSHAGFNAVEDFIQTDAAANPGSSGGALVDRSGRLVGMLSAIFAAGADR
ncbi:MAG: trypsin-like peptidase domain-containing protein [Pseudomonadota bacterium]